MARPSLKDSLMAALSKGSHIETAEKIARGLPPIPEEEPLQSPNIPANETLQEERKVFIEKEDGNDSLQIARKDQDIPAKNAGIKQTAPKPVIDTSDGRPSDSQTDKPSNSLTVILLNR